MSDPETLSVALEVEVAGDSDVRDAPDQIIVDLGDLVFVHRVDPTPGRSRRFRAL
jgi:hypothetical protein